MQSERQFVEHCVGKAREPGWERRKFGLILAKILLLPAFVETAFYVVHYQYLTRTPTFEVDNGGVISSVSRKAYCQDTSNQVLLNTHPDEIETWYSNKAFVCDAKYEYISSHMGLFLVIAMASWSLLVLPMADIVGRKGLNIVLSVILFTTLTLLVLAPVIQALQNLTLITVLICVTLGSSAARALLCLIYASELMSQDYWSRILTFCFFFVGVKLIFAGLHMQFSRSSYLFGIYFNIFVNVITLPLQIWFLPESPHFLYANGRKNQFYSVLLQINRLARHKDAMDLDITALTQLEPNRKDGEIEQDRPLNNADPENEEVRSQRSFSEDSVKHFRSEKNLLRNWAILATITTAAVFNMTLCQAYLRVGSIYAIAITDLFASLAFLFASFKIEAKTILYMTFPIQVVLAVTLTLVLSVQKRPSQFESLLGTKVDDSMEDFTLNSKTAHDYQLILLTRFCGSAALLASSWFGLRETSVSTASRAATVFGFTFALALGSAWLACYVVELALAESIAFVAFSSILATIAVSCIKPNIMKDKEGTASGN